MKKFLSFLLVIATLVCLLPTAFAEEVDEFAMSPEEREVLLLTNRERLADGLAPLTSFPALQGVGDVRAEEIAELFSHTRPNDTTCFTALTEAGLNYSTAGENIAAGYFSPAAAMIGWMNSSGHRANILNPGFKHIGVGYHLSQNNSYRYHWMQMFYTSYSCSYTSISFVLPENNSFYPDTDLEKMGITVRLSCRTCGDCYMPLNREFCSGYDPKQFGEQTVTVNVFDLSASFSVNILEHEHSFTSTDFAFCDKTGYTEHTCSVCGYSYIEEGTVPAGHDYTWRVSRTPRYDTEGLATGYCTRCYTPHPEEIVLPKLNTNDYIFVVTTPSSCVDYGVGTFTYMIGEFALQIECWLPLVEHTYESTVIAPSCTEIGYTYNVCTVCGDSSTNALTDPLGHSYKEGVCTRCGHIEDDSFDPELPDDPFFPLEPELPGDPTFPEEPELPGDPSFPEEPETPNTPSTPSINPFHDVKDGDYFAEPVLWAVGKGITNGMSATSFAPNAPCTRGQIVTFLWRACGSPEPTKTDNPFKDVKPGEYYYKAVLWAVENGITTGLSATTFGPSATCTRGQVATFLWRSQGEPAPKSSNNPFSDVKVGDYYCNAVLWAVENDVTQGVGGGKFAPNASCTRGQIVTFLFRAIA